MKEIIRYFVEEFINNIGNLREKFYSDPTDLAGFVIGYRKETDELARRCIESTLQEMNDLIRDLPARKREWVVEHKGDGKKLMTSVGTVTFQKTLYESKYETGEDGKPIQCYLIDKVLGLSPNQSMTEDAMSCIYKETVQTSYRKGGEAASPEGVTKGTVKKLLHSTKFPRNFRTEKTKKNVEYLYIEADEDHYHLQFREKKGDLGRSESGRKCNGAINKIIYVHEGIEPEAPKSKRHRLIHPHYFCRGDGQDNRKLWEEVFSYIEATYETEKIKKIYISSDGAQWIRSGYRGMADGIFFVLDEYHLSKYISKMTAHMLDSEEDAKCQIYDCIRNKGKADFLALVEKLKGYASTEEAMEKIGNTAAYISSNWTAAKLRLRKAEGVVGSSTEGHVYHVLSSRMSTLAMGWSLHGGSQMARLREYYYNGGDMLELAKYQKEELPMAAGAEDVVLSATQMFASERNNRTKEQQEYGKYAERIAGKLSLQSSKMLMFQLNGKI